MILEIRMIGNVPAQKQILAAVRQIVEASEKPSHEQFAAVGEVCELRITAEEKSHTS